MFYKDTNDEGLGQAIFHVCMQCATIDWHLDNWHPTVIIILISGFFLSIQINTASTDYLAV